VQPLVSILIPAYNAQEWLRDTLESALAQTYPRKEIILVNDGSTDRTLEIAKSFESGSIKIVDQPNAGGPAARNKALKHAQGDYIQWLDHDDLLAPNKIRAQLQSLERIQNDSVLFSGRFATFYYRVQKAKLFQTPLYRDLKPLEYFFIKFSTNTYFQSSSWLVSRKLTDLAGPWWEVRSPDDDGEYFCRLVAVSEGIHFVPKAKSYWRVGNSASFSWAWQNSTTALEFLFKSMCRCIEHFRELEDSERSRAACVRYLQGRLICFYPESRDILDRMNSLVGELGGTLSPPALSWKYRLIKAAFGWRIAKKCKTLFPKLRGYVESNWDKLMYHLSPKSQELGQ
jgi:glycosyltransferase involved in cell wall biosynthesis